MLETFSNWHWTIIAASILVSFAIAIFHYEVLGYLTTKIARIKNVRRVHILMAMLIITCTHMVSVFIYAVIYYIMINILGIGGILNTVAIDFDSSNMQDLLYYSIIVYTSLGFGDVAPTGGLRIISGLETLNGLILVAWSASYSYLIMSKYWLFTNKYQSLDFK